MGMKPISIDELHAHFKQLAKGELVLDVRTPEEFASGHVPGAKNIPFDEVGAHVAELKPYRAIYVYCAMGPRVQAACQTLESTGFDNLYGVVGGGMPNWIRNGYPVER
jgi:rhodanese-related sulfurtransferase